MVSLRVHVSAFLVFVCDLQLFAEAQAKTAPWHLLVFQAEQAFAGCSSFVDVLLYATPGYFGDRRVTRDRVRVKRVAASTVCIYPRLTD